jgi:hypothetical protein
MDFDATRLSVQFFESLDIIALLRLPKYPPKM